jgi:hypothetical protein
MDLLRRNEKISCSSLLHLTSDEAESVLDEIDGMDHQFFLLGPIEDNGPGLNSVHDFLEDDHFELATISSKDVDYTRQLYDH